MARIEDLLTYLKEKGVTFQFIGDSNKHIDYFCPLNSLEDNSITWIRDASSYDHSILEEFNNLLVICNETNINQSSVVNYIFTDSPHSVYFSLLEKFFNTKKSSIISQTTNSVIKTNKIGKNVRIGHFCYVGEDVSIDDDVIIMNNVSIDGKVKIGKNTVIYSGVVIGMDGYGYYDNIENFHVRVPHLGGVIIGENVEIGANTCIAKGCLGDTIIHNDVKIDNLCHIAHNVVIGKRSKIIALSMLAGSTIIGEDVWVAPCAAVKNQVTVGNNSIIGLGAVVTKDVDPNVVVAGVPAKELKHK